MQIVGDRQVRLIPDVLVNGSNGGQGLVDGLLTMLLWNQSEKSHNGTPPEVPKVSGSDSTVPTLDKPPVIPVEIRPKPNNQPPSSRQ
jgi:hypothetical protein